MSSSLRLRAAIVSIALFLAFIGIWHIATRGTGLVAKSSNTTLVVFPGSSVNSTTAVRKP